MNESTAPNTGDHLKESGSHLKESKAHAVQAAEELRAAASEKAQQLKSAATSKADHLRESASSTGNRLRTAAVDRKDRISHLTEEKIAVTKERAKQYHETGEQYVRDNPTKAICTALGVGFVVGLLFRR
ncbi:DUF883 family protein [Sulfuriroseicoccus oceanibius]|uniref:DUF883 family protein n=1 Tax=Sulfuriroseicoccus oceanibius TaxID=2707525 RepID=A0A6B3LC49_9BACT|nr:DUF883 family protein [Sulfuriroseicoccus oceanibius]QQL46230.1 DUF883 family protein [Sulfuriroseicoccus oceanibius]